MLLITQLGNVLTSLIMKSNINLLLSVLYILQRRVPCSSAWGYPVSRAKSLETPLNRLLGIGYCPNEFLHAICVEHSGWLLTDIKGTSWRMLPVNLQINFNLKIWSTVVTEWILSCFKYFFRKKKFIFDWHKSVCLLYCRITTKCLPCRFQP